MDKKQQSLDDLAKARKAGLPDPEKDMAQLSDELAKFYRKYLKELKNQLKDWLELYEQMSFSDQLQVERLLNVANVINETLGEPAINIQDTIKAHVLKQGENGYNGVWYELEQANNILMDFTVLDPHYLEQLMEQPVAGKRLSKRLGDNVTNLAKASNNAISRGFMMGKGYADIARDISTETQASYNRAVRIARTEGGRVNSLATQKGYEEAADKGIDLQKMWLATLDGRTRSDHGKVDGTIVGIDGNFSVGGYDAPGPHQVGAPSEDINCRCTTRPIVHGIMPTVRRDNITGKVGEWQSYDEWLNGKSDVNSGKMKGESLFPDISFEKYDETSIYRSDEVMQWANDVTKDEKNSVGYYTGAGNYSSIRFEGKKYHLSSFQWNEYVQTGKVPGFVEGTDLEKLAREFLDNHTRNLDSALDKGKSPFDMVTMRGMSKKEFDSLGTDKQVKSYRSTTIDYNTARQYASDNREDDGSKYLVDFHIRKGSKGAYVWQYSMYPDEEEWLLPRNAKFNKVGETYIDKDGINRAVFEVIID